MKFDYSLFPKMDKGYLIIPKPCDGLESITNIYDRFCSAIYMASNITGESSKYILSDNAKKSAYLRAALAEFVSIEDAIAQQFEGIEQKEYKIYKSRNPLFHFMKLLRNYNIHLSENKISDKLINVSTEIEPDKNFDINVSFIDNLSTDNIIKLKSAKDYKHNDIEKMISYFEIEQHKFGVSALIIRGIIMYSKSVKNLLTSASS